MTTLRLALAQQSLRVGDVTENCSRIASLAAEAKTQGAQLLALPELALCGQGAQDLLLRPDFRSACESTLVGLAADDHEITMCLGHPQRAGNGWQNGASMIQGGKVIPAAGKQQLDTFTFDEARYFSVGAARPPVLVDGVQVAVLIGGDINTPQAAEQARAAGAQLLLVIAATPFHESAPALRRQTLQQRNAETGLPIAFLNLVGGHDDLVYDGGALLVDADGTFSAEAPLFKDALLYADFDADSGRFRAIDWPPPITDSLAVLWASLCRSLHDYVVDNGFPGVVLGLSGGIDSGLALALAADALGAKRVDALMLPSRHTSQLSLDLAAEQAGLLGVNYHVLPIDAPVAALECSLQPAFAGRSADVTEENLQARCRGIMLMAWSNKRGPLLLSCSNKSEVAVGYSTLYGDMCGGFAPLKDVYKTQVWELARWRNAQGATVIPPAVIERPPTAELREDQSDQQSLPPYSVLDPLLRALIDTDASTAELVESGHDPELVRRIVQLLMGSQFKRHQSAPGTKVTARALQREWRMPVSHAWRS